MTPRSSAAGVKGTAFSAILADMPDRAPVPSTPRSFDPDEPIRPDPDPVAQWLDWEQQANLVGFRTSTQPVEVEVACVPRDEVEVHILPGASAAVVDRFVRGSQVFFPRHP